MKSTCCGERMRTVHNSKLSFMMRCKVCKKVYKQRKRQPKK